MGSVRASARAFFLLVDNAHHYGIQFDAKQAPSGLAAGLSAAGCLALGLQPHAAALGRCRGAV